MRVGCSLFTATVVGVVCFDKAQGAGMMLDMHSKTMAGSEEHLDLLHEHQKLFSTGKGDLQANMTLLNNNLSRCKVAFGGQEVQLVLDTGSTNCWVTGTGCNSDVCKSHARYDPSKSATHQDLGGSEVDITYGTGGYGGNLHQDTVTVGGKHGIEVTEQQFIVASDVHGYVFNTKDFSGVLGLGFRSLAFNNHMPLFDHMVEKGLVTQNQFYFYMPDSKRQYFVMGEPATFHDHYSNDWPSKDASSLMSHPVTDPYYWSVDLDDVRIGNRSILSDPKIRKMACGAEGKKCKVAFDSGSALNTVPSAAYDKILDINQKGCKTEEIAATLTYVINGRDYTFTPADYIQDYKRHECHALLLQNMDVDNKHGPLFLLGAHFHQKFLVIYRKSKDGKQGEVVIGLAAKPKKHTKKSLRDTITAGVVAALT